MCCILLFQSGRYLYTRTTYQNTHSYKCTDNSRILSQTQTDRQTDGQTDGQTILKTFWTHKEIRHVPFLSFLTLDQKQSALPPPKKGVVSSLRCSAATYDYYLSSIWLSFRVKSADSCVQVEVLTVQRFKPLPSRQILSPSLLKRFSFNAPITTSR